MSVVKCIMMQRDETLLLEPWLRYHGYLFGFDNLYVFDNGSRDPIIDKILTRYEMVGVTVVRGLDDDSDFLNKGSHIGYLISRLDQIGGYDFAIPLDCDEFLSIFTEDGVSCDRTAIHRYLDRQTNTNGVLHVGTTLFNVPGRAGWFWPQRGAKRFFYRDTLDVLDHGFHIAQSRKSQAIIDTPLTHIHFHHKPYEMLLDHSRRKLAPYVDVTDPEALRAFQGPNCHTVRHLLVAEQDYQSQFDDKVLVRLQPVMDMFAALGIENELLAKPVDAPTVGNRGEMVVSSPRLRDQGHRDGLRFRGSLYRNAHSDLLRTPVMPTQHYLYHGHDEGRAAS